MTYNYREYYDYCRKTVKEVAEKVKEDDRPWLLAHDHWESFTDRFVEEVRNKKVFLDVGAGLGFYSLLAKEHNQDIEIIAIEADPARADALRYCLDATVYGIAVGGSGNDTVIVDKPLIGSSSVIGKDEGYSVPMLWLSDLMSDENMGEVDIMKVDIEGAELEMMRGATQFFTKVHPLIFIELHNSPRVPMINGSIADLVDVFKLHGYKVGEIKDRIVLT